MNRLDTVQPDHSSTDSMHTLRDSLAVNWQTDTTPLTITSRCVGVVNWVLRIDDQHRFDVESPLFWTIGYSILAVQAYSVGQQ